MHIKKKNIHYSSKLFILLVYIMCIVLINQQLILKQRFLDNIVSCYLSNYQGIVFNINQICYSIYKLHKSRVEQSKLVSL